MSNQQDKSVEIGPFLLRPGNRVFIVAELSANHGQDFGTAVALVRAAQAAGADAVKVQTYTPETMTIRSERPEFRHSSGSLWEGRALYELYQDAYMPWDWQPELKRIAEDLGLLFFSTAYDPVSAEFLARLDLPAIKIASFELVDLPLIDTCARLHKPLILSTGMATEAEIRDAVGCANSGGASGIVLLKCTSGYPSPVDQLHLKAIPWLAERFHCPVGLSDHSGGIVAPVVSVALGSVMIEKHFSLDRHKGLDAAFSLDPPAFSEMVRAVRDAEAGLQGEGIGPVPCEGQSLQFRRSLYVTKDLRAGDVLSRENIRAIRPGLGLSPKYWQDVEGKRVNAKVEAGTPLRWDLIDGDWTALQNREGRKG